jgi:opacity protein-like surface antigen
MKRILLATAAAVALTLPAMAQNNMQPQNEPHQQTQMQQTDMQHSGDTMGSKNYGQQTQSVDPSQLSKDQIRQIQMSLNKKGFDSKDVDGVWGPDTKSALENFQKERNIKANGELTQQTLTALGVNVQNQQNAEFQNENKMNRNAQNEKPNETGTVGKAPSETTGQGSSMSKTQGSSNSHVDVPTHYAHPTKSNATNSSPSSNSGDMSKSNQ